MILIDNRGNTAPYISAAIEEYMVRSMSAATDDYIMLYINAPCAVVGKNQCIYKEVNANYLKGGNTVIRRISGGGTVYHDEGNLCFAFVSSHHDSKVNNYPYFNQTILDALNKAGIDAIFNKRNDIVWRDKKISGNAQFTNRKNIISHGTILVNSDLNKLRAALKENDYSVHTKAVSSVRSSVMNISDGSDQFKSAESLQKYLLKELPITDTYHFTDAEWQEINQIAKDKFQSYEWLWGRNPHTMITKADELRIEIDNGKIVAITSKGETILPQLKDIYYTYKDVKEALAKTITDSNKLGELLTLLF